MNLPTENEMTFEIVPAELGLEIAAKNSLELAFSGFFTSAAEWKAKAAAITDPKAARSARLELRTLRVSAEKTRKSLKEDSIRMGKAIDGANNILLAMIVPIEKSLEDIEKEEERKEAARIESVRIERTEILLSICHAFYGANLGTMSNNHWQAYLQDAKDVFELRQERERVAKEEGEAAAKKEAADREAQRLENVRLREEAEKAAAELAKERVEQAKRDAAAKAERDAMESKAREVARKTNEAAENARKAAAAELAKEQEAKAKLEAEAKALRDAEANRIANEKAAADQLKKAVEAAARKAAAAPDRAKLMEFASKVRSLVVPLARSEAGREVAAEINRKVESFAKWIETQAATL
jgi:hypothetical protein